MATSPQRTLSVATQRYETNTEKQSELPETQGIELTSLGNAPEIAPAITLRPYQQGTVDGMARASIRHRAVIGVGPTGSGKTVQMLATAERIITKRKSGFICAPTAPSFASKPP
jgi:superfamily II DNA or RNA helicase